MTTSDRRGAVMPFEAHEVTLANDLRVIVVNTGYPHLASVQIPVKTGSRNEVEEGKSGFAHFFEHMMFRGTEKYPPERYQAVTTRMGARQNAYTTDDYTNYHVTIAAEDLDEFLEMEADRFMHLKYSEEDFKTESRAILGEYNKSSADPLVKLLEVQRDNAFTRHTYKHTTMGFLRDIEAMPNHFEYSLQFFERWYRPEYTTIIVAGDVQPDAVAQAIEQHWGSWERGGYSVNIPKEPPPEGPVQAHVPWRSETLPWVTLAFHGPAFADTEVDYAALDLLLDLQFGPTSEVYKRLVEREQVVDQLMPYFPGRADPALATVLARVKDPKDARYVRDVLLETFAESTTQPLSMQKVEDGKSFARYGFVRTLDNSESIASTLAQFVHFERSYDTVNRLFEVVAGLTPDDLLAAGQKYLADSRMVQTTLATVGIDLGLDGSLALPTVSVEQTAAVAPERMVEQPSASPLLRFKLLFETGSVDDPAGKEGLAELSAAMVCEAGSASRRYDEIMDILFPIAGSFDAQVDREMTTFTGVIHRDHVDRFLDVVLEQLTAPGLREEDFRRLKAMQLNALVQDLRAANEEELAKERLQQTVFHETPYGHPSLGTVAGIEAITVEDIRDYQQHHYTRARLRLGIAGGYGDKVRDRLQTELAKLPKGSPAPQRSIAGRRPRGLEVEIIQKDTRATGISFGHPIEVTRGHPDWVALWLARAWFGEHRASSGRLFHRIREVRGMNYGNYAYIEAFPGGMYQFFPDANLGRRAQLFEIWLRPMVPDQAVFGFKVALWELRRLIERGLDKEAFEETREYLSKNVFVATKTQDQQLGYALDSAWFAIPEFASYVRDALASMTLDDVNAAVRRHLDGENLFVTCVAGDAEALRYSLLNTEPTTVVYEAPKPDGVLAEDREIGTLQLGLTPERVRITPVEDVFAG
jgi:zinc protease